MTALQTVKVVSLLIAVLVALTLLGVLLDYLVL